MTDVHSTIVRNELTFEVFIYVEKFIDFGITCSMERETDETREMHVVVKRDKSGKSLLLKKSFL